MAAEIRAKMDKFWILHSMLRVKNVPTSKLAFSYLADNPVQYQYMCYPIKIQLHDILHVIL